MKIVVSILYRSLIVVNRVYASTRSRTRVKRRYHVRKRDAAFCVTIAVGFSRDHHHQSYPLAQAENEVTTSDC